MRSTRTPAQWCASFLLLVAAGTHVPLIEDHLEEAPYVGWLFSALRHVSGASRSGSRPWRRRR